MDIRKLSVVVALALGAGQAMAAKVSLDPQGLGQGLLFPYFTSHDGKTTLLSVQNTTPQGKALKLRVLDSDEGFEALLLNVYVPAFGRWSGALTQTSTAAGAPATLISGVPAVGCTVPTMPATGFDLSSFREDHLTRGGYVEVVEMGTLSDELAASARTGGEDCAIFAERSDLDGGIWSTNPNADIGAPGGGLRGNATIVDVEGGTAFSYMALAFNGLAYEARHSTLELLNGETVVHFRPGLVDIQTKDGEDFEVDIRDAEGHVTTLQYPSYAWGLGVLAINALLTTTSVTTDFQLDPGVAARTEWIVSFPTKLANAIEVLPGVIPGQLNFPPFQGDGCDRVGFAAWNLHGETQETQSNVELCARQVLKFATGDAPISTQLALADDPVVQVPATSGTARLDLRTFGDGVRYSRPDRNGKCILGLPAWVMAVQSYDNANAQEGRIATFPVTNLASGQAEVVDCATVMD